MGFFPRFVLSNSFHLEVLRSENQFELKFTLLFTLTRASNISLLFHAVAISIRRFQHTPGQPTGIWPLSVLEGWGIWTLPGWVGEFEP